MKLENRKVLLVIISYDMLEEFVLPLVPREKSLPPRISIYVKLHFKFCLIPGHFNLKQDRSRKRVSIWTGVMDREHQKVRVFVNMLGHPGARMNNVPSHAPAWPSTGVLQAKVAFLVPETHF